MKYHKSWHMVFDMSLGGMLTDWKSEQTIAGDSGKPLNQLSEVQFQWARQGDVIIPVSKTITVTNVDAANPNIQRACGDLKFTFKEFQPADFTAADFDSKVLRMASNASVTNQITNEQFLYSAADPESRIFGESPRPSTQKSEEP